MPANAAAPIPAVDLERVLEPNVKSARTLPAAAYVSDDMFAWERRHLFDRAWVCVGRADLVSEPGDQHALVVAGQGVLLTRDADGQVHAFRNSCRHRGHELLKAGESACGRSVRCPYHSWSYRLDGTLRAAPHFVADPDFDPSAWPLPPVHAVEWCGWIFVSMSPGAGPFNDWITDLGSYFDAWTPADMRVVHSQQYTLDCNWKTLVENYAECYHCPSIHPELCRVSPPDSGNSYAHSGRWNGARMELREDAETMALDGRSRSTRIVTLSEEQARHIHYFYIAPNLLVALHPDFILTHRISPKAPGRTEVECQWLFPETAISAPGFDPTYAVEFWDITNRQDFGACESVHRGIVGQGYQPGLFDEMERGSHAFQAQVAKSYTTGSWVMASRDLIGVPPGS